MFKRNSRLFAAALLAALASSVVAPRPAPAAASPHHDQVPGQLLPRLASEAVVIAGPHMPFPAVGRLRKEANGYIWAPLIFTDLWAER